MKRCIAILILMFAAACGGHSKEQKQTYVFFDVTASGQSEGLLPENTVVNSEDLLAYERNYQRPLVNGHAKFFANSKVKSRYFRLDFADKDEKSSLLSTIIYDWQPLPTVQVNGCKLGYADLVTKATSDNIFEYRLQGKVTDSLITGNDCAGKLIGDMVFSVQGPSDGNQVVCKVQDLPGQFSTAMTTGSIAITNAKPRKRQYLCNITLEDNTSLISPSMVGRYGYDFSIQAYHVTDYDITSWDGFVGYLVYIDENGNASPVLPHIPGTPQPIPLTSVSLEVRGYGGLQNPLQAYCDFGGLVLPVDMLPTYAEGSTTIVVSQSVTFANVATNMQYACNFMDTVTGQWIYYPPPSTASENYVFIVNGIQVMEPSLNNIRILIDASGNIVVTRHTVMFTAIPSQAINPEVNLILGNTGNYLSYPMQLVNGQWVSSLSLPYGVYEANIDYASGAYTWLTELDEYGAFHVADISNNVTPPGLRLDQYQDAVIYASYVAWPPPNFVISHKKNYLFRIGPSGLYGQSATTVTIGITIGP